MKKNETDVASRLLDERGIALPAVLAVLTILAIGGASAIAFATQGAESVQALDANQVAQEYAENGLEAAKRELAERPASELYDGAEPDSTWRSGNGKRLAFEADDAGVFADVRIALDPARSTTTTNAYEVTSTGHEGDKTRRLSAVMVAPKSAPVAADNAPPQAVDDAASVESGASIFVNVMSNDSDPEGNSYLDGSLKLDSHGTPSTSGLSVLCDDSPSFASQDPNSAASGDCRIAVDTDLSGTATFSYVIRDAGGLPGEATVTVTAVRPTVPTNSSPLALDDTVPVRGHRTGETATTVSFSPMSNDTDGDGDALSIAGTTQPVLAGTTTPAGGTLACPATAQNACTYSPPANLVGDVTFTYTVTDGKAQAQARVTLVVSTPLASNSPPIARCDGSPCTAAISTAYGTPVTIPVLTNDTDPDNDPLVVTTSAPAWSGGSVSCSASSCTASPTTSGTSSFNYSITDGKGHTASATVTLTVQPYVAPNRAPVARPDTASVPEDGTVAFNVLADDSDPDGDSISVTGVTNAPNRGTVSCAPGGRCTYTPDRNYSGTDAFVYAIADGRGGTASATVTITVVPDSIPSCTADNGTAPAARSFRFASMGYDEVVQGTNGDDTLDISLGGVVGRVRINGLGGNDTIRISGGSGTAAVDVTVVGGGGADTVQLGTSTASFATAGTVDLTGDGCDYLAGADGVTAFVKSSVGATIDAQGGEGNDALRTTAGGVGWRVTMNGGAGASDLCYLKKGSQILSATELAGCER